MSVRRAAQTTISFPMIDASARPSRKTGLSLVAGDTKISKDGASFVNTTNQPAEIGSTGRYSLVLTAAEMDAAWVHVYVTKTGADDFDSLIGTAGAPSASVVADGGNTATTFKSDRTEATTDYWKDALVLFTSGTLAGQVKKVSAYNGTTKFVTVSAAFTGAPSAADRFVFVNF